MTLNEVLNIIYPMVAIVAALQVAHNDRRGWLMFVVVTAITIVIGMQSKQYGIVVMGIIYIFLHLYSYYKWGKQHDKYKGKQHDKDKEGKAANN